MMRAQTFLIAVLYAAAALSCAGRDKDLATIAPPTVSELRPNHGPVGSLVEIGGEGFDGPGGVSVAFGAVVTTPESRTADTLIVRVPGDAKRGPLTVTVGKQTSEPLEFIVTQYDMRPWKALSARGAHACGLRDDDTLWCWGDNMAGQLGVPQYFKPGVLFEPELYPMRVESKWRDVSVPPYFLLGNTCAQRTDESVWCWGDNGAGPLPKVAGARVTEPIRLAGNWDDVQLGGWLACGRRSGDILCWSRAATEPPLNALANPQLMPYAPWATYSVGYVHACGIRPDGALWCWGLNESGELGDGTTSATLTPVQVGGDADWAFVSAGGGVRTEGKGLNTEGFPEGHTCAIKNDGALWCWGSNEAGQLASPDDGDYAYPQAVDSANRFTYVDTSVMRTCAIRVDGTLWCWGGGERTARQVGNDGDWRSFFSGRMPCGLKTDGQLKCFDEYAATVTEVVVP